MIVMSILITVFYPIGGGILSACFASFANWLSGGDDNDISWGAVLLIVVVFMIIGNYLISHHVLTRHFFKLAKILNE